MLERQNKCAAMSGLPSLEYLGTSHVEVNAIHSHTLSNLVSLSRNPCRMSPVKPDHNETAVVVAVAGASSIPDTLRVLTFVFQGCR